MSNMGVITLSSLLSLLKETRSGRMASLRSKLAHYQCQRRSTISLRARLSLFWDTAAPVWQQHRHRERRKDYASQNWRRLLFTFARREWWTASAQSRNCRGCFLLGQRGLKPSCLNISRSAWLNHLSLWETRTHYCKFWGELSVQKMFGGAVICIKGVKKDCGGRSGWDKVTAGQNCLWVNFGEAHYTWQLP